MSTQSTCFFEFVLEAIFPKFCCGCGRINTYLCANCYNEIDLISLPITLNLEQNYLSQVRAAAYYHGVTAAMIKTLKYDSVKKISFTLAQLIYHTVELPSIDIITATPLHREREKSRGFNQSELVAQQLSQLLNVSYVQQLERIKFTTPQAEISDYQKRRENVYGHFSLKKNFDIKEIQNKKILIIDDVCTTGSTLNECARVLTQAGAASVYGCTVAHGG